MKVVQAIFLVLLLTTSIYSQDYLGIYNVHGKVTDGLTTQGLSGVSVKYIQMLPDSTSIETFTDANGNYSFAITSVDVLKPEIEGKVNYISGGSNSVITLHSQIEDEAELTVVDILGQEVYRQRNELSPGINNITINIPKVASSVYFTRLETSQKVLINKLQLPFNNWGSNATEIIKNNSNDRRLNKTQETTFRLEFKDQTEQRYPYIIKEWDPETLTQDKEYNTPLLPKKALEIPFINPRNNEQVNNTRELLFFVRGVDYLLYSAYKPIARPITGYLDIQNMPSNYSEQNIRSATLEMLTSTNMTIDTSVWKETSTQPPSFYDEKSTIGYRFLPTSDPEMGDYDMIITYIISATKSITSLRFYFNTDRIEPEQIGNFIKQAWYVGVVGPNEKIPGYFTYDPRDSITNMTPDENIIYSNMFQYEDRPTWISAANIPENNFDTSLSNFANCEKSFFSTPDIESYSIGFKSDGSVYLISDNKK